MKNRYRTFKISDHFTVTKQGKTEYIQIRDIQKDKVILFFTSSKSWCTEWKKFYNDKKFHDEDN
jgi:hypothetical protein